MSAAPPRFEPLRRASSPARIAVLMAGPLLWLAAFVLVGIVIEQTDAIGVGLAIAAASFAVAVPVILLSRRRRVREECEAEAAGHG